jgi:rhodanese-related sulfurtransferase
MNIGKAAQAIYLLDGDLALRFENDQKLVLRGGSPAAKHPVNSNNQLKDAIALTDIDILRIDVDLLDIMMTWDQLSSTDKSNTDKSSDANLTPSKQENAAVKLTRTAGDWMNDTDVFSAVNLQSGMFSQLPAANVDAMFKRMTSIPVSAGQVVIQQGAEGDYYYLIQRGSAVVSRVVDVSQPAIILAELKEGGVFGEEALVSDNKRNATVTMKTDGELLRLNKQDFIELLKAPLITQVSMAEAQEKVAAGALWADARLRSEYQYDHIEDAINLPLNEIRQLVSALDKSKEYVLYCQTGRRSSVAAFILVQNGIKAIVLEGGTRKVAKY